MWVAKAVVGGPVLYSLSMTTADAVGDVTYMIAPLMVVVLVKKTKQGEQTVTALAESVTKTVST